jgi:hypothetical protein
MTKGYYMKFFLTIFLILLRPAFSMTTWQDELNVYFQIPLNELIFEDKMDMLDHAKDQVLNFLSHQENDTLIEQEIKNSLTDTINEKYHPTQFVYLLDRINRQGQAHAEGHFRMAQIIPSAFIIAVGGKLSGNWGVGVGASGMFYFVIQPFKLIQVNKETKKTYEMYTFKIGTQFMPTVNMGGGAGGGIAGRFGLGLIWGSLEDPSDFVGSTVGMSFTGGAIKGVNLKIAGVVSAKKSFDACVEKGAIGAIWGYLGTDGNVFEKCYNAVKKGFSYGAKAGINEGVKYVYATAMIQSGASAELEAHAGVGYLFNVWSVQTKSEATLLAELFDQTKVKEDYNLENK